MSLTLLQLRTFAAVYRAGSVRAAAEELFVSQPSVSAVIGALEREIGAELFERRGRGIEPTAAGVAFESYAREILALAERGALVAQDAAEPGRGRLSLVGVTTAAEYLLPQLMKRFASANPLVQVTLEVGNRALVLDRLRSREADLGIGGRPPASGGFTGRRFAPNDLVVVGPPALRSARLNVAALSQRTWLVRESGSGTRSTTEEFFAHAGIEPTSVLTLGSNGAVKEGVRIGLGLALLPEIAVRTDVRARRLAHLTVAGTPVRRAWYALSRTDVRPAPAAEAFMHFLATKT